MIQEALSIELPVRPESARKAREAVTEFRSQLDESTHNDLRLVVSELVADAVLTEAGVTEDVSVRIELGHHWIRATVIGGVLGSRLNARRPQLGEPGWGIYLAEVLGQRWGNRRTAENGSVWVEMELSDRGS